MSPEDVKTMKVSRTDLVKAASAAMLEELRTTITIAEAELEESRGHFRDEAAEYVKQFHGDLIAQVVKACGGRADRLEYLVVSEIILGQPLPEICLILVRDGFSYDCNFTLQFAAGMRRDNNPIKRWAVIILRKLDTVEQAKAASQKKADLDSKAREALVKAALESTPEGQKALSALAQMRKDIK